ncbi:MAG: hypothetical protein NC212_00415 [Staphylococcus sp.]|nr:hypothetical protein [Staphylococcus sp.]
MIRIKVVQLLYSYLLTQSEFKIEPQVENPSRDKKYGHELYLDLLLMVLEMSGFDVSSGRRQSPLRGMALNKHIDHNALARSLNGIDEIRSLILRDRSGVAQFEPIIPSIYDAIPSLPAYKSYVRIKKPEIKDDVILWTSIITNLIAENPEFMAVARKNPGFTMAGFTRGIDSLMRTLNEYNDNRGLFNHARNALDYSLDKAHELYHSLLLLGVELTRLQDQRLDAAKHKYLPTDEDLHPNMRFVENKYIKALEENEDFQNYLDEKKLSWDTDALMLRALLDKIVESDIYKEYMSGREETTLEEDADFWRQVYKTIILSGDELAETLESKSVYWNDDLHVMGTFVLKTIRRFGQSKADGKDVNLLPKFKDDEDSCFGSQLFELAVKHYQEYREQIDAFVNTHRWDAERLAFMDIVIMVTALAEILNFPAIPLAVSLNEYIEIANAYSTPRSGAFINGILYSVINHLKEEGKLMKA